MRGRYFDGVSAAVTAVEVEIEAGQLNFKPAVRSAIAFADIVVSERLGTVPRSVRLPGGARLEFEQTPELEAWLSRHGVRRSVAEGIERQVLYVIAALVGVVAVVLAVAKWGVPWLSGVVADRLPDSVLSQLDTATLAQLDDHLMTATELTAPQQQHIRRLFDSLRLDATSSRSVLVLRKGNALGANAFTLPNGTVVLTDELAGLARADGELAAVLLHELGHVAHRHPVRLILNHAGLAAMSAAVFGDLQAVGTLLIGAPSILMEASYSRALEWEADSYALSRLSSLGISANAFADMLARLERCQFIIRMTDSKKDAHVPHAECELGTTKSGSSSAQESAATPNWENYLSSHPATEERVARFRAAARK